MLFKIGTTVENFAAVEMVAIPGGWESNGVLCWPAHLDEFEILKLRQDPESIPANFWQKKSFTLKATATNYKTAEKLQILMCILSDADIKEAYVAQEKFKAEEMKFAERQAETMITMEGISAKLSNCIQGNLDLHNKVDGLQKSLCEILKRIGNGNKVTATDVSVFNPGSIGVLNFPIKTLDTLERFELVLTNSSSIFEDNLIKKLLTAPIARNPLQKPGSEIGLVIVGHLIIPDLLAKFSWSGRSHSPANKKLPFMKYTAFFNMILKLISKIDPQFNREECEKFFKFKVLKPIRVPKPRMQRVSQGPGDIPVEDEDEPMESGDEQDNSVEGELAIEPAPAAANGEIRAPIV